MPAQQTNSLPPSSRGGEGTWAGWLLGTHNGSLAGLFPVTPRSGDAGSCRFLSLSRILQRMWLVLSFSTACLGFGLLACAVSAPLACHPPSAHAGFCSLLLVLVCLRLKKKFPVVLGEFGEGCNQMYVFRLPLKPHDLMFSSCPQWAEVARTRDHGVSVPGAQPGAWYEQELGDHQSSMRAKEQDILIHCLYHSSSVQRGFPSLRFSVACPAAATANRLQVGNLNLPEGRSRREKQ